MDDASTGGWALSAVIGQSGPEVSATPPAPAGGEKPVVPLGAPGAPQTGAVPAGPAPAGSGQASPLSSMSMFVPVILVFVVMILLTSMSGRKEKKRREALLSSIRKHDRVQTLGGVIGTIAEIDEDEVVLKLDEGRMRVSRGAIQTVLREARGARANGAIEEKDRRPERAEV